MTAFLSLIFILLVAFVGAVIESASIQTAANYRRADMNRAMESVFAEYQIDLLEAYDIFALEGSYETGEYDERMLTDRLAYYGASDMDFTIDRIQFLTDQGGHPFFEQVITYMENKYGVDFLADLVDVADTWEAQDAQAKEMEEEQTKGLSDLGEDVGKAQEEQAENPERSRENLHGETMEDWHTGSEENVLEKMNILKRIPILPVVTPGSMQVSEKAVTRSELVSHRELNQGEGDFSDQEGDTGTLGKLIFGQYVLDHFPTALSEGADGALDYGIEYLIAGNATDRENLTEIANKLVIFRTVINMVYLEKCVAKKAEAEAAATALCTLVAAPYLATAATHVILGVWAYGESLVDMHTLLKGKKVPLTKTDATWTLSITNLWKMVSGDEAEDGKTDDDEEEKGGLEMSYKDYLRMLLFLTKKEDLTMRTLDLIEQNLQTAKGDTFFKADQCITRLEVTSTCKFRRGIVFSFPTYFGYN